jgi:acyl-CoA synthetase (AMP-forming)/AMP-acid ligase II
MEKMHHNIACSLERVTNNYPNQAAVVVPHTKTTISFKELNDESSRIASGLNQYGFQKGDCVLLLVPFSIRFISIVFALFKAGTVPILIDPGLGKKNILKCIKETEPQGIIATPVVHFILKIFQKPLNDIKLLVTAGSFRLDRGKTLKEIKKMAKPNFTYKNTSPNDPAAILFTSGSTGSPKGVLYTHEMFSQQLDTLRSCYNIQPGGTDLSTFPLFSLFGIATGMTSILPEMDFTKPAKVNPKKIINTIIKHNISSGFGSPALWDTISRYCISKNRHLPSMNRILMAGAPIPGSLLKRFDHILKPESKIHTPYGATEALPVTTIERKEILGETFKKSQQGYGTCVGRAVSGMELKVIKITDTSITQWDDSLKLTQGEIGEIVVKSPWTTQNYFKHDKATRLSKIKVNKNLFWHRMGDVGYIDEQNRLWFCGRKNQRIQTINGTLFTVQCEGVFNAHPKVKRSALVGVGKNKSQRPVIIIELEQSNDLKKKSARNTFIEDLFKLGSQCNHTHKIKDFLIHQNFPVDIRHNAKISREILAQWATKKLPKHE